MIKLSEKAKTAQKLGLLHQTASHVVNAKSLCISENTLNLQRLNYKEKLVY